MRPLTGPPVVGSALLGLDRLGASNGAYAKVRKTLTDERLRRRREGVNVARIVLDGVTKVFGRDVIAVNDVSLEVGDGEFMVLVGPSGCGKSTLLRIVAGLEELTDGEVIIGDTVVTDMTPKDRDIAMVFQNYALYPHMTVAQNLGIGLKMRRTPKAERQRARSPRSRTCWASTPLLERKPAQLSGGQRQRVAIGRAMVREPRAFLMDEPLSNLDAKLRVQMRAELARLRDKLRTTTIYVTHDQVEAMTLGDRVAVMKEGVVQQLDTPHALYWDPANLFVAAFIGSPSMNLIEARVDGGTVRFGSSSLPLPRRQRPARLRRPHGRDGHPARPTSRTPRWSATTRGRRSTSRSRSPRSWAPRSTSCSRWTPRRSTRPTRGPSPRTRAATCRSR